MSLTAALLAGLLHALTALALWWLPTLKSEDLEVEPIEVTLEQPATKQPATPAPQAAPSQPSPAQPSPAQPPPPPAANPQAAQPAPPSGATAAPTPQAAPRPAPPPPITAPLPPPPASEAPQQAARPPEPPLDNALPPLETPPPPITSRDFPKPPPKPPAPQKPSQQTHAAPSHQQRLAPSPLSQHQNPTQQATAPKTTFINPAQTYAQTKARDDYLYQVLHKFSQYLPNLQQGQAREGGSIALTFVIARDGRLVDARIAKSSGISSLDRSLLEAMRAASPYPPLPSEISGDRATFYAPLFTAH